MRKCMIRVDDALKHHILRKSLVSGTAFMVGALARRHRVVGASMLGTVSVLALVAGIALSPNPAWADGGRGVTLSSVAGGAGGTDGTQADAVGQAGGFTAGSNSGSGGGGGAVDLTTGSGAHGGARGIGGSTTGVGAVLGTDGATGAAGAVVAAPMTFSTAVTGGIGGAGQTAVNNVNTTGGGGGGGVGVTTTADITVSGTGRVTGGAGFGQNGGGGGGGGAGVFSSAMVTVEAGGRVTGGAGGGGSTTGAGEGAMGVLLTTGGELINSGAVLGGVGGTAVLGSGGDGGTGVLVTSGGTITNAAGGSIAGGAGGGARFSILNNTIAGLGGVGVKGANITLINAGTITGGMGVAATGGGPPAVRADAVQFTGGVNSLEIQSGSTITGNVVAFSAADTLKLGGNANGSFDVSLIGAAAQYQGFGLYEKTGASTWTLTGTTTEVTPWTISAGTLAISADNNLGAAGGGLTFNGGTLENTAAISTARTMILNAGGGTFQTDADLVASGMISGAGALAKAGTGKLTLTADNIYSGGTTISAGTLQLGDGGTAGSIGSGNVVNNGTLAFDRSDAGLQVNGEISGAGNIAQIGTGTTTLTGDSSAFSGATTVQSGILSVNGALGGTMNVLSGGMLQGNGTVGATTILAGGTIAPGNSIGTLHINGPFLQSSGSTYQVQLDPNSSASDLIAVNGAATLQAGAILSAGKGIAGNYSVGTTYNVVNASGGVTGTYVLAGDTAISAFLKLIDSYDANSVFLKVVQTGDPGGAAQTGNQTSTAGGANGTSVQTPLLNSPTDQAARDGLDQLSGAGSASAKGAMIYDSRYTRQLAIDRLRDAFCTVGHSSQPHGAVTTGEPATVAGCGSNTERFTTWAQGFGSWGHTNGNGNAAAIDRSSDGFVTGIDTPIADGWRVGLLTGYSRSEYNVYAQSAATGSDDYHFGVYGGSQWGALVLRLGGTYTWHDIASSRMVALPNFANHLTADYSASTAQAFGELGYQINAGRFSVEPFANLAYVNLHTDGFTEQGGAAALTSRSSDSDTAFTTLGLRASTDFMLGAFNATARGTAGWLHAYGDITSASVVSFLGGSAFTVTGVPIDQNAAVVSTGLDLHVTPHATLGIAYDCQFGDSSSDQSLRGTFTMQF